MDTILAGLRAAAEPTRLRLLRLLRQGELTVSELTHILGQSQPRVSRHLKLMCEAGLLDRFPEGAWVFYRIAARGPAARLAERLLDLLPADDPVLAQDRTRLEAVQAARAARAQSYFAANAHDWDRLRSLHADETLVERALADAIAGTGTGKGDLVDLGTGTARMLEVLAPMIASGIGIDLSRDMLALARTNLERAGLTHCMVRQGDITQVPLPAASADTVTIHQVLHYAADPAAVVAEAARILRPGGQVLVVDFAPHDQEALRDHHAHRRLGFADAEVAGWFAAAGLMPLPPRPFPGAPLTVVLWRAVRPASAPPPSHRPATGALA